MRGWWNMHCFNRLSPAQQDRLVNWGNLPMGYEAEMTGHCRRPCAVFVECEGDAAPGPRGYCWDCAIAYLIERRANAEIVKWEKRESQSLGLEGGQDDRADDGGDHRPADVEQT